MNLAIKMGNLQHLQVLQDLLFSRIMVRDDKISIVKLHFFNFVNLVISILIDFSRSTSEQPLNLYILNYFIRKYESPFNIYRHMYGFVSMWKKYIQAHEEARILLSLLATERGGKQSVKLFLKIRKAILKNLDSKILQQIALNHQDIIAISHTIFSPEMKAYAAKKIHELYTSLKKKTLYSNNKINGAVICQFFMNCAEKFEKQELQNIKIYYQDIPEQNKDFSKQRRTFKPLQIDPFHYIEEDNSFDSVAHEEVILNLKNYNKEENKKNKKNNFIGLNVIEKSQSNLKQVDPLEDAKNFVNRKYSYSWQKFLKTNQQMKEKLLKNHQQNM